MSNTATCGTSGSIVRATSMPSDAGGLCSGASGDSLLELGDHRVVDDGRPVEDRSAVHHPVPDRDQPAGLQIDAVLGQLLERHPQRRVMVGDGRRRLTDPLDDAVRQRLTRIRLDQLIFQRRRTGVQHQHGGASHRAPCAWIAVIATVLTMSSTSAPRDRSFTGLFSPCSTGPIAIAPALRCTAL